MLKKTKTKKNAVILCFAHDLLVIEKFNFASLLLEIQDLPAVLWSCFLDRFISIFGAGNHCVMFQDLNLSTNIFLANYFDMYSQRKCISFQHQRCPIEKTKSAVFARFGTVLNQMVGAQWFSR